MHDSTHFCRNAHVDVNATIQKLDNFIGEAMIRGFEELLFFLCRSYAFASVLVNLMAKKVSTFDSQKTLKPKNC